MKVKEVYQYLGAISSWESKLQLLMNDYNNLLVETTELHKRKEVMPTEENETRKVESKIKDYTFDDLYNLYCKLIDEKIKIYDLIEKTKIEKNMRDSLYDINKSYRNLIERLTYAANMCKYNVSKRNERGFVKTNDGVGTINYEVEITTKPLYESNYFLEKLDKLSEIADKNSNDIDTFKTDVEIDYIPRWSRYSKIEDLLKG